MSFINGEFDWSQPADIPNLPENNLNLLQYLDSPDYDINFPAYTNEQWNRFDAPIYPLPPFTGFEQSPLAYAYPSQYIVPTAPAPMGINPMETISAPATYDSPPEQARSTSFSDDTTNDTDSQSSTPRATSPVVYSNNGLHPSSSHPNRHAPYNLSDRGRPAPKYNQDTQEFTAASLRKSLLVSNTPANAVFRHSSPEEIHEEMNRLSESLRNAGLSTFRHHPYMRCPVYDCERGGHNPLLHGPLSSTPKSALGLYTDGISPEPEYTPIGTFFAPNEIMRHIRAKHAPDVDLRCGYATCPVQTRLDNRAGGFGLGRFCRADVLRTHLRAYPAHREGVPEEVRSKYKLWKDYLV